MLFTKAYFDQLKCLTNSLDIFCRALGQMVSKDKSVLFYSSSVSERISWLLANWALFSLENNLRRYLGVLILYNRVSKITYQTVVDRVLEKVRSWHARNLSFARRITLVQSILTSIPMYTMQSTRIPRANLNQIQRIYRRFLLRVTKESNRRNLVS